MLYAIPGLAPFLDSPYAYIVLMLLIWMGGTYIWERLEERQYKRDSKKTTTKVHKKTGEIFLQLVVQDSQGFR
jgi:putative Mn2+ efflux pump MntP